MTDHEETESGPDKDQHGTQKRPGIVHRRKQLYSERPEVFAVGVIGFSALVFLLGGIVSHGMTGS